MSAELDGQDRPEPADTEIVALSYSGEPQPILYGPNAGEMARVGLDSRGQFVIVPVGRIIRPATLADIARVSAETGGF